jgi:hypothetical protein
VKLRQRMARLFSLAPEEQRAAPEYVAPLQPVENQGVNNILKPLAASGDACSHCGYDGPRQVLPNGWRCGQCGAQFEKSQSVGLSRKDLAEGTYLLRRFVINPAPFKPLRPDSFSSSDVYRDNTEVKLFGSTAAMEQRRLR